MATAGIPLSVPSPQVLPVAFAAVPVFDASKVGNFGTFQMTLTGAVTSSTLVNGFQGQVVNFVLTQDGTGSRTIVYPTNAGGIPNILSAASAITRFSLQWDGIAWQAYGPVLLQQIAAYSNATTAFTSIPEIGFTVAPSRNYRLLLRMNWSTNNTAAAPTYQFTGPGSGSPVVSAGVSTPVTASTLTQVGAVAFSSAMANAATVTTATQFVDTLDIGVNNGTTAGTVQLQLKSTSAAGTVTMAQGSGGILICS